MNVLIACEFSGIVREAFNKKGHNAWSCDFLPTEIPGNHYECDIKEVLYKNWDLVIAHPPCTDLSVSGARWFKDKDQRPAIDFFKMFTKLNCRWAIENPIGIMSTRYRKPDQIVQPWQFGHGETKATCLWLNDLPNLRPTNIVKGREGKVWRMAPGENRWKDRSRTYPGIAEAMANQWG